MSEPATGQRRFRPAVNDDTAFWWEGARQGELRIQECLSCGTLRHPPCPMCAVCNSRDRGWVLSSGRGVIHSWVVHHHPPVRGMKLPYVVVLVELPEGIRVIGNLLDGPDAAIAIGAAVDVDFAADAGDDMVLAQWRLA